MTNAPPIPADMPAVDVLLNASALNETTCRRRYRYTCIDGLVPNDDNEFTMFGNAVHYYAEDRLRGHDHSHAFRRAITYYGDRPELPKLVAALGTMPPAATFVPPYNDPERGLYVEHKFRIYWRTIVADGTAYNIWICGTMDVVSFTADGMVRIVDWKTARKRDPDEIFAEYAISTQFQFYLWVAQRFAFELFPLPLANAAHDYKLFLQPCVILLSWTPVQWRLGPALQTWPAKLAEFEQTLLSHIYDTIIPAHDPARATPDGLVRNACSGGYKCRYAGICHASTPEAADWARARFGTRAYDPAAFR